MENISTKTINIDDLELLNEELSNLQEAVRFFFLKDWCPATSSNYSIKKGSDDNFFLSRSGIDKSKFSTSDMIQVDFNLTPLNGSNIKMSAEGLLHTCIYTSLVNLSLGCILHTHSIYNTLLSKNFNKNDFKEPKIISINGFEIQKGFEGVYSHNDNLNIPIFENSQDMNILSKSISAYLLENPKCFGFLLAGHGFYTWGKNVKEAKRHIETAEFLFECLWQEKLLNKIL